MTDEKIKIDIFYVYLLDWPPNHPNFWFGCPCTLEVWKLPDFKIAQTEIAEDFPQNFG